MPTAAAIVGGGLIASRGSKSAAKKSARAADAATAEQRRQFDLTREDLLPFLETGQNALTQFQAGIDQAPGVPQLQQFQGQAVAPTDIQRFQGQAVGAPQLEQFQFDPNEALNSPALAFQRQQGDQALQRNLAGNRQLGSGARLLAAQEFGQGLATQSLGDEFNRQFSASQARNQAAGQQFGLSTQQLGQEQGLNQLANQQNIQQQNLERQFLGDRLSLDQTEQNRLLTQFGLTSDQFNQRLNRLAGLVDVGARTGGNLASSGAQTSSNISNILQNQGNTQAAARLGQANILGGVLTQGIGAAAQGGLFGPSTGQAAAQANAVAQNTANIAGGF